MLKNANPADMPKLHPMLMWTHCYLSTCLIYPVFAASVLSCTHARCNYTSNQNSPLHMFL